MREITVIDKKGNMLEATYAKRARGLIKSGRAEWVDGSTIRMLNMEEKFMDNSVNEHFSQSNGPAPEQAERQFQPQADYRGYEVGESPFYGYSDEELFKLAKKRVKERNGLIIHIVAYVAVNIFLFMIALLEGDLWNFFVLGGWGIGVACHIASYLFSSRPENVHAEFMKLKTGRYRY